MHKVKSMWMGHGMASVLVMLAAGSAVADLVLPAVISSRMVLQRGQPAPIWGTAGAGSRVTVDFAGRQGESIAGADGRWLVRLAPLDASTNGRPMTIVAVDPQGQREERRLDDILVGEVWLGSGQSNMAMPVNQYGQDRALAASAARSYPAIRLIRSGEAAWQAAEPPANRNFSALLFAFGVVLQRELDVPVGLLVGAVGGTPSG
ncbi:MAG: sialate O-acetylesterase, partial [Lentisphaerae bacterium]|nr:sialate O-acetylesterase [Lentisphaerota bacterium]